MNDFDQMLDKHLLMVKDKLIKSSDELLKRAQEHDIDKFENKDIYKTYKEHFPKLKKIPFGTEEYYKYEKEHFDNAHQIHAQNRHHFYSHRNNLDDINLFDLIEAIIDISQSSIQYGNEEGYKKSLKDKGILNYELEELVVNTIEFLNNEK